MKSHKAIMRFAGLFVASAVVGFQGQLAHSQAKGVSDTVQVHVVITNEAVQDGGDTPLLTAQNVTVTQGKTPLKVTQVLPAKGENAALLLFILIDDTCDTGIGNNLSDIKDFVNAQPATTMFAVGYMSNANVQITQDFTADHALVVKAIRLPRGTLSSSDSPYLSLISLLKRLPVTKVRRQIIMVSDGIDRLRGANGSQGMGAGMGSSRDMYAGMGPTRNMAAMSPGNITMNTISVDAETASQTAQRYGIQVNGIYAPGVGRLGRNSWEAQLGQSGVGMIADESGGEYFALGNQQPVNFKNYLDRIQKIIDNQYYLVFDARPKNKAGLQRIKISSDAPGSEIAAPDNVWVPAIGEATRRNKWR
jgi:hypothetical protein